MKILNQICSSLTNQFYFLLTEMSSDICLQYSTIFVAHSIINPHRLKILIILRPILCIAEHYETFL